MRFHREISCATHFVNTWGGAGYRAGDDGVVALTIGMATYNDFNGVYFTLQALRLYQDLRDTELLVVDNYGCPNTKQLVEGWVHGARYVLATEVRGTERRKIGCSVRRGEKRFSVATRTCC